MGTWEDKHDGEAREAETLRRNGSSSDDALAHQSLLGVLADVEWRRLACAAGKAETYNKCCRLFKCSGDVVPRKSSITEPIFCFDFWHKPLDGETQQRDRGSSFVVTLPVESFTCKGAHASPPRGKVWGKEESCPVAR